MFLCLVLNSFTRLCRNHENCRIRLTSSCYHIFDKVSVSRAIYDRKVPFPCFERFVHYVYCNSSCPFFLYSVHDESKFKSLLLQFLCNILQLPHFFVSDGTTVKKYSTH